jgi:tyrosine-protein kinase Etk/Wzc
MAQTKTPIEVAEEKEINLLELLRVLVQRKVLVIKVCSIAIVASVIYSLALPNVYCAGAKVLPPQKESAMGLSAVLGQMGGLAGLAGGNLGIGGDLYLGILKSRSVGDAVIRRLGLEKIYKSDSIEAARSRLEGAVKVQVGKDGIITITAEDADPKRAALLANAFVEELGRTTIRLNLSKAGTERVFLEKRLELVKKDLKAAEEDLKSFAQNNKIIQVDAQARATIEGIARLKAELAGKEVLLAVARTNQTEESPEVKALSTGLSQLKGQLDARAGNNGGGEGIPSLGKVPGVGLEYSRKLRELKTQEAIFEQLTKQFEMAKLNEAKDSSSFQVLDEAVVPVNRLKPKRTVIVIVSTLLAFVFSLFLVFAQQYLGGLSAEDRKTIDYIKRHALNFKKPA